MTRSLIFLHALLLTSGCAVRTSSISAMPVIDAEVADLHSAGLPESHIGCGWVYAQESAHTKLFMMTLGTRSLSYDQSLFYCCPGEEEPDPKCYQAMWYGKAAE